MNVVHLLAQKEADRSRGSEYQSSNNLGLQNSRSLAHELNRGLLYDSNQASVTGGPAVVI